MIDFYRLFRPRHWFRNHPTSLAWDKFLLDAAISGNIVNVDEYTVVIGGIEVWTSNHPYASFTPYRGGIKVMPTAKTVDILANILLNNILKTSNE